MEQLIFSVQQSLFHIRYNCLKLTKSEADDYVLYTGLVYPEYENLKLRALSSNTHIYHPTSIFPNADIRMRMLFKLEQDKNITVKTLTSECQPLLNFKHDFMLVKQSANQSTIRCVRVKEKILIASKKYLAIACWPYGKWHYTHYCRFQ